MAQKIKITMTCDALIDEKGNILTYSNMSDEQVLWLTEAKKKGLPLVIVDCMHLDWEKASKMTNALKFRQMIMETIDKAEKAGLCSGVLLYQPDKK